jgi:homoserine kinase type II
VATEHAIMQQLQLQQLSFQTPRALPSLTNPTQTFVRLSSGDDACVFHVIPGVLPRLQAVTAIGRASGELHTAMARVHVNTTGDVPYHELFRVHRAITRDLFYDTIASKTFDAARADINRLVQHVRDLEDHLQILMEKNDLPTQLIHGDLHYDNVLMDPVTQDVLGLLDFEYCGVDWRAMELAVCLSKYAGEPEALTYFEQFVTGFAETAELTPDEIDSIPDLMVLRIISNVRPDCCCCCNILLICVRACSLCCIGFSILLVLSLSQVVYFVGRVISNEDKPEQLISRAGMYNDRIEFLLNNREKISSMISQAMAKHH